MMWFMFMFWFLKIKYDKKKYDVYDISFKIECKFGKNMWGI